MPISLRSFLATLCTCVLFTQLSEAAGLPDGTSLSTGKWQGVVPCVSGADGLYPIEMQINGSGSPFPARVSGETYGPYSSRQEVSFTTQIHKSDVYATYFPRIEPAYVTTQENGRADDKLVFINGPTAKYLWSAGTPRGFGGKCVEAILVQEDETMLPSYRGHNDFCGQVSAWSRSAPSTKARIERTIQRGSIPGYDPKIALIGHQFSTEIFDRRYFRRDFSTFSNTEIRNLVYRLRDCARYSKRAHSLIENMDWFFSRKLLSDWQRLYPHVVSVRLGRSYTQFYSFEDPIPNSFLQPMERLLQQVRDANRNKEKIDSDLENLFLQPESPELRRAISSFLSKHSRTLMFLDFEYVGEVLNLVNTRREMLRASESLALRFRLSEYPKLPPPNQGSGERLIDDALLRPLTDEEIRELEQNVEQDF